MNCNYCSELLFISNLLQSYGERLGAQIVGALVMICITAVGSFIMYGILYLIPMKSQMSSSSKLAKKYNKMMSW